MIKFLRTFVVVLLAGFCVSNAFAVETAEQVLSKCASKISKAPSVDIKFNLNYGDSKSKCELIISRDKYRLSSADMEVWYDGATQWSYLTSDKEVTITEPLPEELLESNPFAIITNYKTSFTFRRLAGDKNEIELVAKNKMSSIKKAVITIDGKTYLPTKLVVTMANGHTFAATVTSAAEGKQLPAATFIYNKNQYPAKTTIDLR